MDAFINFFGPALLGLIGAATVYLKIRSERNDTKAERDNDFKLLEYRVTQVESSQSSLAESIKELQNSVIALQMSVNQLVLEIKYMREENKK